MIHPSRLKYSSDYATTTNDAVGSFTVVVPDTYTLPASGPFYLVDTEYNIGSAAASMRLCVKSSRTGLCYPSISTFYLPAKVHYQYSGEDSDTTLIGWIYRSAPSKVRVRIIPNITAISQQGDRYYDMGQTLTISASTFLSPFFL